MKLSYAFAPLTLNGFNLVGFPRGTTHQEAEAVVEGVFKSFNNDWESWSFDIEQYLDAKQTIIVIGTYAGRHRLSGKSFRSRAAHVYDIGDGKLSRFRQFTDTKLIWDASDLMVQPGDSSNQGTTKCSIERFC